MGKIVGVAVGLVLAWVVFGVIERLFRTVPGRPSPWRERVTDLGFWFLTPIVTRNVARVLGFALVALVAVIVRDPGQPILEVFASRSPLSQQPLWLQVLEIAVLSDFLGYWIHRVKHHDPTLWRIHRVHHSAATLDWLSAARLHPFDELVGVAGRALPLVVLGFSPTAFAFAVPGLAFYALLLHTNVPWSYGPLRYAVASPMFHRWHHSRDPRARGKNLAGLLPLWDLLFGTFYMPGHQPTKFGTEDVDPARGFFTHLADPMRRGESG